MPPLSLKGWFECGHQPGVHLLVPPLGAALIAFKELARSWHKCPSKVTHVVMIPQLLWEKEWQSCFKKKVDLWFIFIMVPFDLTLHLNHFWLNNFPHFPFIHVLPLAGQTWMDTKWWNYLHKLRRAPKTFSGLWWSLVHLLLHRSYSRPDVGHHTW